MSSVGASQQPYNAAYGASAANWAQQQSMQNPSGLAVSSVSVARTSSEAQYHADTFDYAQQDIKNMGGQDGTLTKQQFAQNFKNDNGTAEKMFTTLDLNKDGKIDASEGQAYIELQDDPSLLKGSNQAVDGYLDAVQKQMKQTDPSMPDMQRDGIATAAERTATDGLLLNAPTYSTAALKQLQARAGQSGNGMQDPTNPPSNLPPSAANPYLAYSQYPPTMATGGYQYPMTPGMIPGTGYTQYPTVGS